MVEPKLKTAKENGDLSETAKTFLHELWLRENYGYYNEVITDEMFKGILVESDSIGLAQKVLGGEFRLKNKNLFTNSKLKGTPDIILSDAIEDVKTSFTVKTFHDAEMTTNYFWQGVSYCLLTNRNKFRLIYALVDTPDEIVTELKKRVWFKFNCQEDHPDYIRISMQIEKNHKFGHIPEADRIKVFEFDMLPEYETKLYNRIEKAREYYKTIKL